jgi:hypothetical protein
MARKGGLTPGVRRSVSAKFKTEIEVEEFKEQRLSDYADMPTVRQRNLVTLADTAQSESRHNGRSHVEA